MTAGPVRVGLFGLLGSGNIGNDASLESVLSYLRADRPEAILDAMCSGPAQVRRAYGIEATDLAWYSRIEFRRSGIVAIALKILGKSLDVFRIAAWVRRHEVVIVPGMGVLETTLPVRPFGTPFAIFLACLSGRVFRTKVALVCVGANVIQQPLTRWFCHSAAMLAFYRSYRDAGSRDAMQPRPGAGADPVYPDLAFGLPVPGGGPGDPQIIGVGVMDFHGTGDDRNGEEIYQSYLEAMRCFVVRLVDSGRTVRLYVGDTKGSDDQVIREILAAVRARRPGAAAAQVTAQPASSFAELMAVMAPAGTIVATRYHNLICALRLAKPTISIGYAEKHDVLMADMGMAEFCQHARALDVDRLVEQLTDLENRSAQVRTTIAARNAALTEELAGQFAELSALLFPGTTPALAVAAHREMTFEELR